MKKALRTTFAVLILTTHFGVTQEAVKVGKGSYAAFPPPGMVKDKGVDKIAEFENAPVYLVKNDGRPIPSNQWFVRLLNDPFGRAILEKFLFSTSLNFQKTHTFCSISGEFG